MLNSKKLLYVLPDVAYIAELLPAKKEHTFAIQTFRQINGEFLDDNEFITENIEKLINKIEPEEYHLILPDFLFTNTILEVEETVESKVKTYLKEKLLPSLELSEESHQIETFILTQHQGKSKVQLSALEKSVLSVFSKYASQQKVTISGISSLSWTIKSVVSLEPSLSVIQIGSMLYVAQHYIGLDQATQARVEELENVAETIKTLKGAEPSIQTVYLLTNELVADNLKGLVSSTLPLQQLASFKEEETQMPSYVKQIIESGMKTLDITEYHVPSFALPASVHIVETTTKDTKETEEKDSTDTITTTKVVSPVVAEAAAVASLPQPTEPAQLASKEEKKEDSEDKTNDSAKEDAKNDATTSAKGDIEEVSAELPQPSPLTEAVVAAEVTSTTVVVTTPTVDKAIEKPTEKTPEVIALEAPKSSPTPKISEETSSIITSDQSITPAAPSMPEIDNANLSQFATNHSSSSAPTSTPTVIKNKTGGNNVLRMIFVTLAVFFATVGLGVGIGLGVLSLANRSSSNETVTPVVTSPSPVAAASPSPVASPTASPSGQIKKDQLDILVVNATTISGYAGKTKKLLEDAGYNKVVASNAKGKYEAGTYVQMKTLDPALVSALETDTKLELESDPNYATEDPKSEYDAVIVLGK